MCAWTLIAGLTEPSNDPQPFCVSAAAHRQCKMERCGRRRAALARPLSCEPTCSACYAPSTQPSRCPSTPPGRLCTTSASSTRRWRRRERRRTWCRCSCARRGGGGARAGGPACGCCWPRGPSLSAASRRRACHFLCCLCLHCPQILTGYGEAGHALVTCKDISKLIFVGSTQIGRKVGARGWVGGVAWATWTGEVGSFGSARLPRSSRFFLGARYVCRWVGAAR